MIFRPAQFAVQASKTLWQKLSLRTLSQYMAAATPRIKLTDKEKQLRELLLDTSEYIASKDGFQRPQLRFTGGWVRDKLLGISSNDIDISISSMTGYAFGQLMHEFLNQSNGSTKYSHSLLGTLAKIERNPEQSKHLETTTTKILGMDIDLVNLRKETYSEDSRNPNMEFGTPEEDALRRDATVNALFYNLADDTVEDYTGRGLSDLRQKIIRTPLPPYQTFKDDPLRVLRCIRFASKLGYEIDADAKECMSDMRIKEALRAKISRERVGIEVEKMLRGKNPQSALSLIDSLELYEVIFSDPKASDIPSPNIRNWSRAYGQLSRIASASPTTPLNCLKDTLISNADDLYLAWLLCALTPWSRIQLPHKSDAKTKPLPPVAAIVAREGLKTDNRVTNIIKNAVLHMDEIIASKDSVASEEKQSGNSVKRKSSSNSREALGMSVRRWGTHWRNSAMFSLLVQITDVAFSQDEVTQDFANWLLRLQELELLDAPAIKPIVDGRQIMSALNRKGGPWLVTAMDTAMEFQLRNPHETDPEKAIAAVKERFNENPP